jgi:site-specific DNA-methyltransferase (adenine-specific)
MKSLKNKVVCGDCIDILRGIKKPFVDLVFADPPFNIGYKYDKHNDRMKRPHYVAWTRDWMAACKGVLKPGGSFYVAIGDDYAANVKIIGEELGLALRNWLIWHYTFGQQTKDKFARAHAHIFYFVNDPHNFTFNNHAIRVPSDRQLLYADPRANPAGKMPDDVWDEFSRVCGTFKERVGWHPCQMPEKLLGRIICASSNRGDCVLDPFNGSGTTAAAAIRFCRSYSGIEISEAYVTKSQERLQELTYESKTKCPEGFNWLERNELERLFWESPAPIADVLADDRATEIYARQFAQRMNNGKSYDAAKVAAFFRRLLSASAVVKAKTQKLRTRKGSHPENKNLSEPMLFA